MRKYLAFALAMLVTASALSACGSSDSVTTGSKSTSDTPTSSSISSTSPTPTEPTVTTNKGSTPEPNPTGGAESLYHPYEEVENLAEFKASYTNLIAEFYNDGYNTELSIATGHDYTGDEYIDYYRYGTTELPPSLFDLDTGTKWCSLDDPTFNSAIVWEMTEAVEVIGYTITTADDNQTHTNRCPISWRLYGSNEVPTVKMDTIAPGSTESYLDNETVPEGWTLIDAVDSSNPDNLYSSLLPDMNFEEVGMMVANPGSYKYFMLLIDFTESSTIQLSEFTLYGNAN